MTQRLDFFTVAAEGMKAFGAVSGYVGQCGLPTTLIDLVYLRVSQINGCAYCIDKHSRDLIKQGVAVDKLFLVSVWDEAGELFSAQERAALKWAETVTRVVETAIPDADFAQARAVFSEKELVDITIAVGLMNALNRQAISFRLVPAAAKK
ncbi:MAG: carboxymuconolactone decarboxylase family protein [Magnetospirillum sp.]|nr:carboxymuconolactone decarboxylase family protein [Magnetospirillum sp.]